MNKLAAQVVGGALVDLAARNATAIANTVAQSASEYGLPGPVTTPAQVETLAIAMTTQDPAMRSTRVWAVALPVLSTIGYALLDPSLITAFVAWLQAHPGAWWGVAANVVALVLPAISRALDQRPVR